MRNVIKDIIITLTLILAASFSLEARKMKGKIVFEGETIEVTFNIPMRTFSDGPNFEKLQHRVRYYNRNGKTISIRPTDAKEFSFRYIGTDIRMVSVKNLFGSGNPPPSRPRIFLRIEVEGKVNMFTFYSTQSSPGLYNPTMGMSTGGVTYSAERYVLQKNDDLLWSPRSLSFKKDMSEYFKDCPDLVQKIQDQSFRKDDLEAIVHYYNSRCN